MNQLSSCITTLCLCLLCLFIVVVHADTTENTNVEIVNSSIEGQQQESSTTSSPSQIPTNNNDSIYDLPSSPSLPPPINNNNNTEIICHVIGECEPCETLESKTQDYCIEFGNKEAVECHYTSDDQSSGNSSYPNRNPLPVFQACRRVKRLERTKYFEFQFINIFVAFMSCSILLWRRKKLAADGYRRLARRIRGNTL